MTLSLIWQPRQIQPIFGNLDLSAELWGKLWEGFLRNPNYQGNTQPKMWNARQIQRWETKTGKLWDGRFADP